MKKTEIYQNNEVIYALPPEPIDETEPVCLVDYMLPCAVLGRIISS